MAALKKRIQQELVRKVKTPAGQIVAVAKPDKKDKKDKDKKKKDKNKKKKDSDKEKKKKKDKKKKDGDKKDKKKKDKKKKDGSENDGAPDYDDGVIEAAENTIIEFELDKYENIYIVKVSSEVEWKGAIVPFMVIVYNKEDPSDADYITLKRLNKADDELATYLRENLRIYFHE